MQNVQNAEIQQRVINLVDLYRTKVGKESRIAKDAKADYVFWEELDYKMAMEAFDAGQQTYLSNGYVESPHTDEWIKQLMVNEQLLGHFYSVVAGENAVKDVDYMLLPDATDLSEDSEEVVSIEKSLQRLRNIDSALSEAYDKTVFSREEEDFLKAHFREMVNYIIQTPNNNLEWVHRSEDKNRLTIPNEILGFIKSRVDIKAGSKIFYPNTYFAQLANLFKGCSYYCDTMFYAWTRIALYANDIVVDTLDREHFPSSCDAIVSYLPSLFGEGKVIKRICSAYKKLSKGGMIILLCPSSVLAEKENSSSHKTSKGPMNSFKKMLVEGNAIREIIQLPDVMNDHASYCLLIAEKGRKSKETIMIDAREAIEECKKNYTRQKFDLDAFAALLDNSGKAPNTGLRKFVMISQEELRKDILLPQIYVVEKPAKNESPRPLSDICSFVTTQIKDVKIPEKKQLPWVKSNDLSAIIHGVLDLEALDKIGTKEVSTSVSEYVAKEIDPFGLFHFNKNALLRFVNEKYRKCIYVSGQDEVAVFSLTDNCIKTAVIKTCDTPIAVDDRVFVLQPTERIDVESILALIRMPIVYRQIQAYQEFGLENHLDDILVPTDLRILFDEKQRLLKEIDVVGKLEVSLSNIKKSVSMRKHALTQSLSSIEAMFYALNAYRERKDGHISDDDIISRVKGTTVRDAFEYLYKGLKGMMPVLDHIADVEYSFANSEWIDPELYIEDYIKIKEKGWLNFKPVISWKKGNNQAEVDIYTPRGELLFKKGQSIDQFYFPKDALEHVFKNVISNAQAWAFNDQSRDDYQLKFSWHIDGKTLVIEIENNGTPIPEDREAASLLEYGVSAALHHDGHNGIGCNEIDDIMRRYKGKVEIVSTPDKYYTVKYILTFSHTNEIRKKYPFINSIT